MNHARIRCGWISDSEVPTMAEIIDSAFYQGGARHMLDAVAGFACKTAVSRIELNAGSKITHPQPLDRRAGFSASPAVGESLVRRLFAPQTDRRMIKELMCTTC
jgi:hypothetical protein